jgi:hypothetical protein
MAVDAKTAKTAVQHIHKLVVLNGYANSDAKGEHHE